MDAGILQRFSCRHSFRQGIVRFPIGKQNQDPVGCIGSGTEQAGSLCQHRAQRCAALARQIRIQRVEVHPDRPTIYGERRQDIAAAGKGDEPEPVALQILNQAPGFAAGPLQPARRYVLRQHRTTDIDCEHQAQGASLGLDLRPSGPRTSQANCAQQPAEPEDQRSPAASGSREAPQGR